MAGSRLRKQAIPGARRMTRFGRAPQEDAEVPDVFKDMLSEAQSSKIAGPEEDSKTLKKRKTARSTRQIDSSPAPMSDLQLPQNLDARPQALVPNDVESEVGGASGRILQTIIDSDESDDSDLEWEDALDHGVDEEDQDDEADAEPKVTDLTITIGGEKDEKKITKQVRRRGITSVDKKRRLDIHKMHVLCLLYHVHRRNAWCNDERTQATLRKLPSPNTLSNLVPNPEYTQFQASKSFMDGIQELKVLWSNRFSVAARGMHKPRWADIDSEVQAFADFDELDDPMDKQDFRKAASSLQGSQDVGAQLFCALLRGIGVEARLVCSLQCLPFASAAQTSTPQIPSSQKNSLILDPYNKESTPSPSKSAVQRKTPTPARRPKRISRLERAIGETSKVYNPGVAPKHKKKYHTPYPVYWVEAFNPTVQKWITVDPLSTFTVDKPEKLEPPLNFSQNSLVYAVAFEEDSVAKDVTRRYAKAYNAKTRKLRVECTEGGAKWWKRALKVFKRSTTLDRDQVENAALARKEAAEGVPKNVQDFKDHPIYVLERHLKHNEVIHPMNQVGKVNVGTSMNPKMESIYRRRDVHIVRSADKWYRMGRDVKNGEQPLKHAKSKRRSRRSLTSSVDVDAQQEEVGAGLYAAFQTELYVPPPVVLGRVPRNAFGNLDLYVPSMVPKGGVHIRHQHAAKAACMVGVDYADAVTGFSFKGRHGTAVIQGVVVAREYKEAIEAVLDAIEYAQEETVNAQRSAEALRLWRRFFLGLRIAQRVNAIEIDGQTGHVAHVQEEIEREDKELTEKQLAGGFFPEGGGSGIAEPLAPSVRHYEAASYDNGTGSGSILEEYDKEGGFTPESTDRGGFVPDEPAGFGSSILEKQKFVVRMDDSDGDGFIPEDDIGNSDGGFVPAFTSVPEGTVQGETAECDFMQADGTAENNGGGFIIQDGIEASSHRDQPPVAEASPKHDNGEPALLEPRPPSLPASSPSEAGSLPLEDPEDEDADPEWLVEVT
ncbi:Rad4-domain-containing protein [Zopfia rhizophila CBS 207.26]|uniref:Rad4-domain-containing protein n=1 Tax=Zopfia rhizophila CBS 207.26 TaxID=1314779 RepID=A0A6A6ETH0_9PEZI|nr:Rad4-domain-containing protein [Zopfia rhizophila CBS 207.26]